MKKPIHVLVVDIAARLGFGAERERVAGVPPAAEAAHMSSVLLMESAEVVPALEPGVIATAWSPAGAGAFGFTELQRSALLEIANIGSGNAATALAQLLGKPVEIGYAEALLPPWRRRPTRSVRRRRRQGAPALPGRCRRAAV